MKRFFRWLIGYEPPLCQKECKWEMYEQWGLGTILSEANSQIVYVQKCKTCGILRQERVKP